MLYFIRHGESQANADKVFAGPHYDAPLTDKGRDQALHEGTRLKTAGFHFDTIISSPIERAKDTANLIAQVLGFDQTEVKYDPRFIEYDMGDLSGQSMNGVTAHEKISAKNAQDPKEFQAIVMEAIHDAKKIPGDTLIVSHAGVGRIIEITLRGMRPGQMYELDAPQNATTVQLGAL